MTIKISKVTEPKVSFTFEDDCVFTLPEAICEPLLQAIKLVKPDDCLAIGDHNLMLGKSFLILLDEDKNTLFAVSKETIYEFTITLADYLENKRTTL